VAAWVGVNSLVLQTMIDTRLPSVD
jgi:hypothetical protein